MDFDFEPESILRSLVSNFISVQFVLHLTLDNLQHTRTQTYSHLDIYGRMGPNNFKTNILNL